MLIVTIRTVIMYLTIIAAMRVMGKRQLGELQPSELVTTILISNLASLPIEETDISLIVGLVPIAIIVALEILISVFELRFPKISKLISGNSKIIIKDGNINQNVMNELRYSTTDLLAALRQNMVFDLTEVKLGIIETNGKLNIFTADSGEKKKLMIPLIIDGNINHSGLSYIGLSEDWLSNKLDEKKITVGEVLLFQGDENGDIQIILKESK